MVAFNPCSPWLPTALKVAKVLSKLTVTSVPPFVRDQSSLTSVMRNGAVLDAIVQNAGQPSHVQVGIQGRGLSVTFASDLNAISHKEDGNAKSADGGPPTASQKLVSLLCQEMGGHGHGQATLPSHPQYLSDEDLFGSDL